MTEHMWEVTSEHVIESDRIIRADQNLWLMTRALIHTITPQYYPQYYPKYYPQEILKTAEITAFTKC